MISDAHRAFARAVVALAEEHKVARLFLGFDMESDDTKGTRDKINASWEIGKGTIELRADLQKVIPKEEPTY
jgi:hypothetical protein